MKKNLFLLFALLCSVTFFTACSDDEGNDDSSKWAKTYHLSEYTTGELTYNDFTNENAVLSGAGYVNYVCVTESSDYGTSYGAMFRGIFGALLPQVLKTVTLEPDGNITAEYIDKPAIQFEPMWAFQAPTPDVLKTLIPSAGWISSPKQLATWSEKDGKLYVKLDIAAIVSQSMGSGVDYSDIISQVLNGDAASVKGLIQKLLKVDASAISDESINMLLGWLKNGVPLTAKTDNGHTYFYLDKGTLDSLMKPREGNEDKMSDFMLLWIMLSEANIIPEEAAMAGGLIGGICQNWAEAKAFEIGLDLQAK